MKWSPDDLYNRVENPTTKCRKLTALGGTWQAKNCDMFSRDGHKYVCMDPDVSPVPGNCIVYSFGIGNEMTFDNKIVNYNCSLYAFDMTLVNERNGILRDNMHQVLLGLRDENFDVS